MPLKLGDKCKRGHIIEGDNAQHYMNRGNPHIRCARCNVPPKNPAKRRGDLCKYGHLIDGRNYGERLSFGRRQAYCVRCHNDAQRKAYLKKHRPQESSKKDRQLLHSQQRAAEKADRLIESGKEDSALKYLELNKRSERAVEALQRELGEKKPNCADDPGPYIDYPEGHEPTDNEAYILCKDCPVLVECARFATAYRPPVGVWGGEVYIDGKTRNK